MIFDLQPEYVYESSSTKVCDTATLELTTGFIGYSQPPLHMISPCVSINVSTLKDGHVSLTS